MAQTIYMLFVSFCLFFISICGLGIATAMWRKSVNQCKCICKECDCCK
jgi:hypothetical protein